MKKKTAIILLSCMMLLSGCTYDGNSNYEERTIGLFQPVPESPCLYYDTDTNVVYVMFSEKGYHGNNSYSGYGYMSPYYANNGKPYLYVDGELKEIE